jgi:hypothetical protein
MLKNNYKVILLLLLLFINLFPLTESIYCFCLKGEAECEECFRLPIKFGKRSIFQLKPNYRNKFIVYKPNWNGFRYWWRFNGSENDSKLSRILNMKYAIYLIFNNSMY